MKNNGLIAFMGIILMAVMLMYPSVLAISYSDNTYGKVVTPTASPYTTINNTYINQTVNATVNTTQFDSNNPIHIKESWLTNFIEIIVESYNYLTETQADSLYCKLTGCTMNGNINLNNYNITNVTLLNSKNVSQIVTGNMSSETTYQYSNINISGYALQFDGVDDYVKLTNNTPMNSVENKTVSAWIKANRPQADAGIVAIGGLSNRQAWLYVNGINRLNFQVGAVNVPNNLATVQNNTWYHVVGTWNNTTAFLYVDGILVNSASATTMPLYSGTNNFIGTLLSSGLRFNGSIDEVMIWNRSLNSTEVSQLYNSGNGLYANTSIAPFNSGLVAGWHFDEGSGTTAIDVTGRNNGTIINGPSWVDGKVPHNIATQVLGAKGLMPYVSATNFISTDNALQWDCDDTTCYLKTPPTAPTQTIFNIGNSTNMWDWIFSKFLKTNNLNVTNQTDLKNTNINGNLVQTNGNATINTFYAGMHFHNDSGVAIALNSTLQKVNLFKDIEYSNGFTKLGNDTLQMNIDGGVYQVHYEIELYGVQNHEYEAYIFVNETQQMNTYGRTIGQASSNVDLRGFGFIRINSGQNMTLRVADKSGTTSGSAYIGNINLVRVGN